MHRPVQQPRTAKRYAAAVERPQHISRDRLCAKHPYQIITGIFLRVTVVSIAVSIATLRLAASIKKIKFVQVDVMALTIISAHHGLGTRKMNIV